MTATIISLADFRRGRIRCPDLDLAFPQVYRLTGFLFTLKDDELVATDQPYTAYTLGTTKNLVRIADPRFTPIDHLDPALDSGWVTVRHHANMDRAQGYLIACVDIGPSNAGQLLWSTPVGIFSCVETPARAGCPDHLLIHLATTEKPQFEDEWATVIGPDGSVIPEASLYPDSSLE
jgi:hypothetical protein